jgi:N-acetylmuramoyl-L-alanine amidase
MMRIAHHRLEGDGIAYQPSANHGGSFGQSLPDTIIMHYTAGSSAESSVRTLCDPATKASAHLVIGRNGRITQLVPFDTVGWHAGPSVYGDRVGLNHYSIGIELDNAGLLKKSGAQYVAWFGKAYPESEVIEAVHRNETQPAFWHRYTEEQIAVAYDVCVLLTDTCGIRWILGHEEIAPGRKQDPGPAFPLDRLRDRILRRDRSSDAPPDTSLVRRPGLVTASKLNIRCAPDVTAATVAPPLVQGTIVDILQEQSGWYEITAPLRGWVKKEYVKT